MEEVSQAIALLGIVISLGHLGIVLAIAVGLAMIQSAIRKGTKS
jgi:transketolase N-terminal domain/subunit